MYLITAYVSHFINSDTNIQLIEIYKNEIIRVAKGQQIIENTDSAMLRMKGVKSSKAPRIGSSRGLILLYKNEMEEI